MRAFKTLSTGLLTGLLLVSCVTINIYFPAAAAEKAADRIIEDVWGQDAVEKPAEPETQSQFHIEQQTWPIAVLNWLISPAAAEPNININSKAINAIQSKMKKRHQSLKAFYQKGAIGLTDKGYVAIHNIKAVSLKDRNKVKGLIADENKDRKALYAEIARANGHPEWQADIQATFARRWVDKAAAGWWYQTKGQWKQK